MSFLVGSYEQGIFEVNINNETKKFANAKMIVDVSKPSYLINDFNFSYIYTKDEQQYIKICDEDVLLNEGACHLSYDKVNGSIYTSFYGAGLLKVLNKNENNFQVTQTISYKDYSHIHYSDYIETIDLVGVVDLGDDKLFLYENENGILKEKTYYKFPKGTGPRHFAKHQTLPIIYVINEHKPSITALKYENDRLELLADYLLIDGAGSAIKIDSKNKYLYTAVRFTNYLFGFEILLDGKLKLVQKVHTKGDHPRDFSLVLNDQYLVVANMNSNNLTLFEVIGGRLYLKDEDFALNKGAVIMDRP